jgi:hypothetical protein
VPLFAGSHLQGDTLAQGALADISAAHAHFETQLRGGSSHKPLVGVAAGAAETMIEMRDDQASLVRLAQIAQDAQENHGIDPT